MAKDTSIRTEIVITANAKQADATMKEVAASAEKIKAEIKELKKTGQGDSDRAKWLTQLYQSLNSISRESVNGIERVKKAVADLSGQSVSQLRRARRAAQQFRDSLSEKDAGFPEAEENLRKINNQIELMTGKQRRLSEATKNFNGILGKISTASIDKLNEALKDGEVILNRMSKSEVEQAGVVPGMAKIRQELATRRQMSIMDAKQSVMDAFYSGDVVGYSNLSANQLTEQISIARNALANLPGNDKQNRIVFNEAITNMEAQLQKLNGTLVNTDEVINKTMADVQSKSVTPKQLAQSIALLKQKLDSLPASADQDRKKLNQMLASMIQENKRLRGELTLTDEELKKIREDINSGKIKTVSFEKLRVAAKQMRLELSKIAESDYKYKQLQKDIEKVEAQLNKSTAAVNKHGSAWKMTIKNMMAYVGVFGMLNMVKSKLEEIVGLNLKFSQQLADVRKVSGLTTKQVKDLGNELSKIDSRTSLQGLMTTAYSGAKLGFGEYGTKGLVDFTKAANVASVAIGEELGEDALPALSKIVENMGIIKKYGIEQSMLKTASAMFKLSSSSTATSNNIVEFSKRLTAMSKVAGITTDQLLALGSASDAMYLAPEVSATAFTKLISSIQTSHNLIEKTLGMTKGTINDLFSKGKAMDAIVMIFEKMNKLGNMNALKPIFKDLGSDGARLMNVMTAMAKNVDVLKKHLEMSAEAFRDGTAATAEYNIQQETAEGLWERAKNLWQKAIMNPDNVDIVQQFAKAWYETSRALTTSKLALTMIHTSIYMVIGILKTVIALFPEIMAGLGAAGAYGAFVKLNGMIRMLSQSTAAFTISWKRMSLAMRMNYVGLIVTALSAIAAGIYSIYENALKAKGSFTKFKTSIKEVTANISTETSVLNRYRKAIDNAALGTKERNAAIENFNKKYGTYYKKLLNEKSTVQDVAKAYAEVNKNLRNKMLLEGMQKDFQTNVQPRISWSAHRLQNYTEAAEDFVKGSKGQSWAKATGLGDAHNANWLRGFTEDRVKKGFSTNTIFKQAIAAVFGKREKGEIARWSSGEEFADMPKNFQRGIDRVAVAMWHYISQERSRDYHEKKTIKMWKPYKGNIDEELAREMEDEKPGTLDNDADDNDAKKAAAAAERERKRLAREHKAKLQKDLKAADGQVKSFTKAIDAYYTLQEKAIQELYMQGKINEAEMNRYIALMKSKHDIVAAQGRFSIVGDENNFDELRKQMGKGFDQFDYSSEANKLLGIIQNADPSATGKLIRNLESALGTTPDNSIMNDVRNNGVNSQKSESDRRLKLFEAADSYLNAKNYVVNTGREYDTILAQSGLTDVGLDRGSIIASGAEPPSRTKLEKNPETGKEETVIISEPTTAMRQDFIREGVSHYGLDVNSPDQLRKWLNQFVSKSGNGILQKDGFGNEYVAASDKKDWTNYIPGLQDMLFGIGKDADEKIKILFSTLMQYEEKYYEAKKQTLDYETKILDSRWTRSSDYKEGQTKERELEVKQQIQGIYGRGETSAFLNTEEMARNNGFADNIEGDPEVEKARLRMDMARKEALMAHQTSEDKELLRQKDKAAQDAELAYADKINSQIKARIDLLQQWVDPLQEFSEAMGDAFVKMTESAEEGRDAMKQATENMVKTFAKMTINMIAQQLKMEVQRALFHKRMQNSEKDYMEGMKGANEKGHKSIFKALGSFFKKKKKDTSKNQKEENKEKDKATKEQTGIVQKGKETELKAVTETATEKLNVDKKMDQQSSEQKVQTAQADAQTTGTETQGNIFAGIASGAAKIIGKLGWWGIPLVAVIQGLLMGLLNSALSKLFGGKNKSASNTNTKLVSGMLTYDSGNVEAFSGAIDKKTYPVVGNDGKVYAAKPTDKLVTGLLTEPVATTVNGVPSLVAERGPEMIIGRETTQALMMARPDIISEIIKFDRNHSGKTYRVYDQGNVSEVMGNLSTPLVSSSQQQATQADMANLLTTMQAMMPAMQAFVRQLQQPLKTSINMYGNGGLYDSMSRASKFMKGRG